MIYNNLLINPKRNCLNFMFYINLFYNIQFFNRFYTELLSIKCRYSHYNNDRQQIYSCLSN